MWHTLCADQRSQCFSYCIHKKKKRKRQATFCRNQIFNWRTFVIIFLLSGGFCVGGWVNIEPSLTTSQKAASIFCASVVFISFFSPLILFGLLTFWLWGINGVWLGRYTRLWRLFNLAAGNVWQWIKNKERGPKGIQNPFDWVEWVKTGCLSSVPEIEVVTVNIINWYQFSSTIGQLSPLMGVMQ